ncbi:NAD-dependent epimerase/dehydratase family protein [Sphingomicrobium astaxanthinifaciens]|uniref:NAD-dependent epimerase/dehydratase family protein n=1 Tax=Sphingomicrobium astaxanthinifaciens TaxID=1227949 RepID=UPI001FCA7016|nr:NAD-dependent epimerase/dehydratase family protein [Sphingomicrobium astaxanthinifaciens]MCJ7420309.1 NAD-dependent epimerase/dehydratase family protein [Sphingomicrobium astaxanthinifaciens]
MTILVTGAAGFIGSATCKALLERGERVVGIDNLNAYYDPALKRARLDWIGAPSGLTFEKIDFADRAAMADLGRRHRFNRIIHLGAQAGVRHSLRQPHDYADANLVGHLNLLELARAQEPAHFVYASSSSVYGGNEAMPFSVADRVDHPVSLYAATKRAGELMSESYAHLYRVPMTGLRFFTVYGPWGRPDMAMWLFTEALYKGETIRLFNHGRMRRDFTYIDDIVGGILACLERPPADDGSEKPGGSKAPHALFNIGNHQPEKVATLVAILEEATGRKARTELAAIEPGDVPATFADIAPLQAATGFSPTTPLETGARAFVRWYADYHDLS